MTKPTISSDLEFLPAPHIDGAHGHSRWGDGRHLADLVRQAKKITFLTGAGLSAASGLHTYRGNDGMWKTSEPIYFQSFCNDRNSRLVQWRRSFSEQEAFAAAAPNEGHRVISDMAVNVGANVITQNIDSLHLQTGQGRHSTIELHGNGSRARCLRCGSIEALGPRLLERVNAGKSPLCAACAYIMKPDIVMFGESLDRDIIKAARAAVLGSDLLITVGTSLQVHPAAGLAEIAVATKSTLVIMVDSVTPYHDIADLLVAGNAVDALIQMRELLAA